MGAEPLTEEERHAMYHYREHQARIDARRAKRKSRVHGVVKSSLRRKEKALK